MDEPKEINRNSPTYLFAQILLRMDIAERALASFKKEVMQQVSNLHGVVTKLPCGDHSGILRSVQLWIKGHDETPWPPRQSRHF